MKQWKVTQSGDEFLWRSMAWTDKWRNNWCRDEEDMRQGYVKSPWIINVSIGWRGEGGMRRYMLRSKN